MSAQLKEIQKLILLNITQEAKAAHQKFVPGTEKLYGVRTPVLNDLAKQFQSGGFALVKELWEAGSLEEKIIAIKMLGRIAKKGPEQSLQLIQQFAKNIGNWAVCDAMGMQALKSLLKTHQKEIFALAWKFNSSKDFWQRRLSLVLVEWYTRIPEHHTEIKKLIMNLEDDKEYYVKKAVAWINKNFLKGK
jgi:3-methyladenine DNA glycosylase AlkD